MLQLTNNNPWRRVLSLGAGIQSTTLVLLSAEGVLPKLDAAVFADTGWEPAGVYEHLDRLEREVLTPAGIPLYRVNNGNLRDDVLNPNKMRSIPAYTFRYDEVTVVDQWGPCPDRACDWRRLREVRAAEAEPSLFDVADMGSRWMDGLFVAFSVTPAGTTLAQLDETARQLETDGYDIDDYLYEFMPDEYLPLPPVQMAQALRLAGLQQVPEPHDPCRSAGRVPAISHVERRPSKGMLDRKCTQQYKVRPILEQVRLLLGAEVSEEKICRYCDGYGERVAPWRAKRGEDVIGPCSVCDGSGALSRVGQPPKGRWVEQWIGFSTDEMERVSSRGDTPYSRSRHPLLELGMSRTDCETYLRERGWGQTTKSACIGCPFHRNAFWREMRDTDPVSWQDAVQFDREYRTGLGLDSERFLHISCKPLDQAPIDRLTRKERQNLQVLLTDAEIERAEEGDPDGCSPWACRSGHAA